jgi:hypothetical protein
VRSCLPSYHLPPALADDVITHQAFPGAALLQGNLKSLRVIGTNAFMLAWNPSSQIELLNLPSLTAIERGAFALYGGRFTTLHTYFFQLERSQLMAHHLLNFKTSTRGKHTSTCVILKACLFIYTRCLNTLA